MGCRLAGLWLKTTILFLFMILWDDKLVVQLASSRLAFLLCLVVWQVSQGDYSRYGSLPPHVVSHFSGSQLKLLHMMVSRQQRQQVFMHRCLPNFCFYHVCLCTIGQSKLLGKAQISRVEKLQFLLRGTAKQFARMCAQGYEESFQSSL